MANLSELREGLHVSVSQVKTYLRCPRQYFFRYVVAAEPEFVPRNLVLGSAVHEGLAAFYRSVMETSESPEQDVGLAALHATLEAAKKNRVPLEEGEDDLEAVGTGLLRVFYETVYQDPAVVVGVEVPFAIELHDPVTGEVLEERFVGALDLVIREGEKHVVVEHKTAAKKWSQDQIQHDIQLSRIQAGGGKAGSGRRGVEIADSDQNQKAGHGGGERRARGQGHPGLHGNRGRGPTGCRCRSVLPREDEHVRWVRVPAPVREYLI